MLWRRAGRRDWRQRGRRIRQGGDRGVADPRRSAAASSTFRKSRATDAKAKPLSEAVAPDAAEGEGEAAWAAQSAAEGAQAGEAAVQGRRENCAWQAGLKLRMMLVAKHPNLCLEFWSGATPLKLESSQTHP
jgi:hypothetical protein